MTQELEKLKTKVSELLSENENLPEKERIDKHEFELDVEEQQRRIHQVFDTILLFMLPSSNGSNFCFIRAGIKRKI